MALRIALVSLLVLGVGRNLPAQEGGTATPAEKEGVRRAVLDYVEGFYEGDSVKFVRGVRPELYKYGFYIPKDSTGYTGERMTWEEALGFIRRVKEKNHRAPATAPKQVDLLDVQDETAAAKLTAYWGTDYLLLAKYDGRWMISSVMWQSPPRARKATGTS
jgi:hypothetical protein